MVPVVPSSRAVSRRPPAVQRPAVAAKAAPSAFSPADQNLKDVHKIVAAVRYGSLEIGDAVEHIVDLCRVSQQASMNTARTPEFLDARGMHAASLAAALENLSLEQHTAAACHVAPDMYSAVRSVLPGVTYHAGAQMLMFKCQEPGAKPQAMPGAIAIVTSAGADNRDADECKLAAKLMGCYAFTVPNLSTGSLSGLMAAQQRLQAANVLIVCAGADQALPGVIAGMVSVPVIALPAIALNAFAADPVRTVLASVVPGVCTVAAGDGVAAAAAATRTLNSARRYLEQREEATRQGVLGLASRSDDEADDSSPSTPQQQQHSANNVAPAPGIFHGAGSLVPDQQIMKQALHEALELMQQST